MSVRLGEEVQELSREGGNVKEELVDPDQYVRDIIRRRLLEMTQEGQRLPSLEELRETQWSGVFEEAMRCRLIMGGIRYGLLGVKGKPQYERSEDIVERAREYQETGNQELLVDIANLALIEFVEGDHPLRHFIARSHTRHTTKRIER